MQVGETNEPSLRGATLVATKQSNEFGLPLHSRGLTMMVWTPSYNCRKLEEEAVLGKEMSLRGVRKHDEAIQI
ncbi:MAG: hypothetical protein DMENIID0002_07450 [Rickettsia endosymbiont of Sergentomyia squamirostris]|uniref:Uncharacterized protein n=1 Tax=Candidatus Tisiphia endosymbiont of Sergentomyia squamirostris TaxID=3113639 RepID=A0AAT9G8E4_9RICK